MVEHRLIHQRQAEEHRQALALDRLQRLERIEPAHQRHLAADREIGQHHDMAGAMEDRHLAADRVLARQARFEGVAQRRHHHGEMAVHRALGARRRAASVDDHRQVAIVDGDVGLGLGLALKKRVEVRQAGGRRLSREVDGDEVEAAPGERRAAFGLHVEIVVDQGEAHAGVVEDVVHVGGGDEGVDRRPHQAGAVQAEQAFDHVDRVVADRRDLVAGFEATRQKRVGAAIGVAVDLGEGRAPLAVGQGDAFGITPRGAGEHVADRDPPDASWTGDAARRVEIRHGFLPVRFAPPAQAAAPAGRRWKIRRASAGLAMSRPTSRASRASAATRRPFDVALAPSGR